MSALPNLEALSIARLAREFDVSLEDAALIWKGWKRSSRDGFNARTLIIQQRSPSENA